MFRASVIFQRKFLFYPCVKVRNITNMPKRYNPDCKHGPTNTFVMTSPVGDLEVICCPKGIHKLSLPSVDCDNNFKPDAGQQVDIVSQLYQDNGYTYKPALTCMSWLQTYFHNTKQAKELPLPPMCHLNAEEIGKNASFTEKVWHSLASKVVLGQTVSYGELACLSGSTARACRAVGQAMRTNHVMIIIPCHRVILGSGQLGNYSSGKINSVKEWLLRHEGVL